MNLNETKTLKIEMKREIHVTLYSAASTRSQFKSHSLLKNGRVKRLGLVNGKYVIKNILFLIQKKKNFFET